MRGEQLEIDAEAQHASAPGVEHEQLAERTDGDADAGGAAGTQAPAEVVAEFVPPIERPDVDAAAGFVRGKDVFLGYCDAAQRSDLLRRRLGLAPGGDKFALLSEFVDAPAFCVHYVEEAIR